MITVNWPSKSIYIPKDYLTDLGDDRNWELDVNQLRLDLKDFEDSEIAIAFPDTHKHEVSNVIESFEIINGYTVTFEDGQYIVNLVGPNNNISQVTTVNQVWIISNNTAGVVTTEGASLDIASAVWNDTETYPSGSKGADLKTVKQLMLDQ